MAQSKFPQWLFRTTPKRGFRPKLISFIAITIAMTFAITGMTPQPAAAAPGQIGDEEARALCEKWLATIGPDDEGYDFLLSEEVTTVSQDCEQARAGGIPNGESIETVCEVGRHDDPTFLSDSGGEGQIHYLQVSCGSWDAVT